jgi:RNA-splicing ligase RtcB
MSEVPVMGEEMSEVEQRSEEVSVGWKGSENRVKEEEGRSVEKGSQQWKVGSLVQDPLTGQEVRDRRLWVTRKGATSAQEGQLGIIPGSMGTGSFIVRGRGDPQSWASCSHGAGRAMSRTQAKAVIPQVASSLLHHPVLCRLSAWQHFPHAPRI